MCEIVTAFPLTTLHPKVLLLVGSELLMALLSKCLALTGIITKIIVFQIQCITFGKYVFKFILWQFYVHIQCLDHICPLLRTFSISLFQSQVLYLFIFVNSSLRVLSVRFMHMGIRPSNATAHGCWAIHYDSPQV